MSPWLLLIAPKKLIAHNFKINVVNTLINNILYKLDKVIKIILHL